MKKIFIGRRLKLLPASALLLFSVQAVWAESQRDFATASDSDQTDAFALQLAFGEAKKKGQWQLAYQYKYAEADSTWDAVSDSDWGDGSTDRKGHVVKALYNLRDWWQLSGKSKSSRGDFTASEDDNVLVQGIAGDKNALGYFGLAYKKCYKVTRGVIR